MTDNVLIKVANIMIYLSIVLYIVCVVASFDFYLMNLIIFAIGHVRFSLVMVNKIKVYHINSAYIAMAIFCLCTYLGLMYYNLTYLKSWVISKEEIFLSSKLKTVLLLNVILFLNLLWIVRITTLGKKALSNSISVLKMLEWLRENNQYKKLIFKIARYLDNTDNQKSNSLYLTFLMFKLDDKWLIYKNYYKLLIEGKVIKIKDKNNNIYAFTSYQQLLDSNLKISQNSNQA